MSPGPHKGPEPEGMFNLQKIERISIFLDEACVK